MPSQRSLVGLPRCLRSVARTRMGLRYSLFRQAGQVDPFKRCFFMIKIFTMEGEDRNLLVQGGKTFGIDLDEKTVEAFELYLKELLKWNQKINLTAIRSERGIV